MNRIPAAALGLLLLLALPGFAQELPRLEALGPLPGAGEPVAIVVHGINPTPGQTDALARELVAQGYRTFQFHYDDGQRLNRSAQELGEAARSLLDGSPREVAIVAHSMGGLVSRRALTEGHPAALAGRPERFRLVTIASPFGGFPSANFAFLNIVGPRSHLNLGTRSRFIRRPGPLGANVTHVKLETDERDATRRAGERERDDDIVGLDRQRQEQVDAAASAIHLLALGHVGSIVDEEGRVPAATRKSLRFALDLDAPRAVQQAQAEGLVQRLQQARN